MRSQTFSHALFLPMLALFLRPPYEWPHAVVEAAVVRPAQRHRPPIRCLHAHASASLVVRVLWWWRLALGHARRAAGQRANPGKIFRVARALSLFGHRTPLELGPFHVRRSARHWTPLHASWPS